MLSARHHRTIAKFLSLEPARLASLPRSRLRAAAFHAESSIDYPCGRRTRSKVLSGFANRGASAHLECFEMMGIDVDAFIASGQLIRAVDIGVSTRKRIARIEFDRLPKRSERAPHCLLRARTASGRGNHRVFTDPSGATIQHYGAGRAYLVRPDEYIGFCSSIAMRGCFFHAIWRGLPSPPS